MLPIIRRVTERMVLYASFLHIVYAKLGQADAGDNEAKLMTKLAPEWVRISDPVIKSPARYRWTMVDESQRISPNLRGSNRLGKSGGLA